MAKVILITSGDGGVGKTTLAVNLGEIISKKNKKVTLIECDSGRRNMDILLGVEDSIVYDFSDVVTRGCSPEMALIKSSEDSDVYLIPASYNKGFLPKKQETARFINILGKACDCIILDCGNSPDIIKVLAPIVDMALVVTTPYPVSVREAGKIGDALWDNGVKNSKLVINKVELNRENPLENFDEIMDNTSMGLIAVLPYDREIYSCNQKNFSPILKKTLNNLANRLFDEHIDLAIK